MTKEEILSKHIDGHSFGIPEIAKDWVKEAMDEYAKQQAIAFARFININYDQHGDNYVSKKITDNEVYFTDELYSKLIEQQNKQA